MSARAVFNTAYTLLARRADDADRLARAGGQDSSLRADLDAQLFPRTSNPTADDGEGEGGDVIHVGDFSLVQLRQRWNIS